MEYEFFFQFAKVPLLLIKHDGFILKSNYSAQKYNLHENKILFDLLTPLDATNAINKLAELKTGNSKQTTIEISSFPDHLIHSRWSADKLHDPEIFALSCEELRSYSEGDFLLHKGLMRSILDRDPNLISIVNKIGRCLLANMAVYEFAKIKEPENQNTEYLNKLLEQGELILPGSENTDSEQNGSSIKIELTSNHNGEATWFENNIVPVKLPFGEDVRLIISKNITKWKMTDKKIEELLDAFAAQTKISFLGEVISNLSQETNAPCSELYNLLSQYLQTEQNESLKQQAKENMEKLKSLTFKISNTAKFSQQILKLSDNSLKENAKISDILNLVLDSVDDRLKAYEINVIRDICTTNEKSISCRPSHLALCFFFILSNSIDAILMNKNQEKRMLQVSSKTEDTKIIIKIEDNGSGVAAEMKEHMFEPFYTTKPSGKNPGVSLHIAKRFIEDMGGEIAFESKKNSTIFKILFEY